MISETGKIIYRHIKTFGDLRKAVEETRGAYNYMFNLEYKTVALSLLKTISEIIVLNIVPEILGNDFIYERGSMRGSEPDIIAIKDGIKYKVEVKSTSPTAFQALSSKDLSADIILWMHHDKFFQTKRGEIRVIETYQFNGPFDYLNKFVEDYVKRQLEKGKEAKHDPLSTITLKTMKEYVPKEQFKCIEFDLYDFIYNEKKHPDYFVFNKYIK